jgi:hypothetical protein
MAEVDWSSELERRAFLGGAALAGVAPGLLPLLSDGTVAGLAQGDAFEGLSLKSQLQADAICAHAETIAKAAGTSMKNAGPGAMARRRIPSPAS